MTITYKESGKPVIWKRPKRKMINIGYAIKISGIEKEKMNSTDFLELNSIQNEPLICMN